MPNQNPIERRFRRLAVGANRKARRVGAVGRLTAVDLFEVFRASGGFCAYCGISIDPLSNSFDHVVPFNDGGDNLPSNLNACCLACQRGKFTKTESEYEQWRELRLICPVDGVEFRPRWSDYRRGYGKYCSRRCSGAVGGASRA